MNKFTQTYKPINLEQRLHHSVEKTEIYSHLQNTYFVKPNYFIAIISVKLDFTDFTFCLINIHENKIL